MCECDAYTCVSDGVYTCGVMACGLSNGAYTCMNMLMIIVPQVTRQCNPGNLITLMTQT